MNWVCGTVVHSFTHKHTLSPLLTRSQVAATIVASSCQVLEQLKVEALTNTSSGQPFNSSQSVQHISRIMVRWGRSRGAEEEERGRSGVGGEGGREDGERGRREEEGEKESSQPQPPLPLHIITLGSHTPLPPCSPLSQVYLQTSYMPNASHYLQAPYFSTAALAGLTYNFGSPAR